MKNNVSPTPKSVSEKTDREEVKPVRVSDMGMRIKATKEVEKKQPTATAV